MAQATVQPGGSHGPNTQGAGQQVKCGQLRWTPPEARRAGPVAQPLQSLQSEQTPHASPRVPSLTYGWTRPSPLLGPTSLRARAQQEVLCAAT